VQGAHEGAHVAAAAAKESSRSLAVGNRELGRVKLAREPSGMRWDGGRAAVLQGAGAHCGGDPVRRVGPPPGDACAPLWQSLQ
jgi:hypothetical protein